MNLLLLLQRVSDGVEIIIGAVSWFSDLEVDDSVLVLFLPLGVATCCVEIGL